MPDCDVTLMFQLRLRNILKRINATRIKEKMRFLNCESYPCPFRRVMSTEIVLQVVCSSTLAVDSVASLTIPMYPKTDPDRLINGHLTHNISFTHSEYFYSASSSPLLLRGTPPTTALILCRNYMLKHYRQLCVMDLPKVPMWWLEWDSNLQPFGCKAPNIQPKIHNETLLPL